jgi:hypothetical protein
MLTTTTLTRADAQQRESSSGGVTCFDGLLLGEEDQSVQPKAL